MLQWCFGLFNPGFVNRPRRRDSSVLKGFRFQSVFVLFGKQSSLFAIMDVAQTCVLPILFFSSYCIIITRCIVYMYDYATDFDVFQ